VADWGFLASHARILLHLARDSGARLRNIVASPGITSAALTASSPTWPGAKEAKFF
jgi:hypothetical protein